jgi:hypothetical protein
MTLRMMCGPNYDEASRNEPGHHLQPRTLLSGAFSLALPPHRPALGLGRQRNSALLDKIRHRPRPDPSGRGFSLSPASGTFPAGGDPFLQLGRRWGRVLERRPAGDRCRAEVKSVQGRRPPQLRCPAAPAVKREAEEEWGNGGSKRA